MKIKVLGAGCPTCKKLYENVKLAVEELGEKIEIQYIPDIQKVIEMGLMQAPVIVIDDKPVVVGSAPNKNEIKKLIQKHLK